MFFGQGKFASLQRLPEALDLTLSSEDEVVVNFSSVLAGLLLSARCVNGLPCVAFCFDLRICRNVRAPPLLSG